MSLIAEAQAAQSQPRDAVSERLAASQRELNTMAWDSLASADLMTRDEIPLLQGLGEAPLDEKIRRMERHRKEIFSFFIRFLGKASKANLLQAILLLLRQILEQDMTTASYAQEQSFNKDYALLTVMFRLANHDDWFVSHCAMNVLKVLLSNINTPIELRKKFFVEINRKMRATGIETELSQHDSAVLSLQAMLKIAQNRVIYAEYDDSMLNLAALAKRYREKNNPQVLYIVLYCVWLLTFDTDVAPRMGEVLLGPVIEVLKKIPKEKVVRISLSILRNLQKYGRNSQDMIVLDLVRILSTVSAKHFEDEDILNDIKFLQESLQKDVHELSSFETYRKEVLGGELFWSPVHTSETFWRENIMKFEANDFQMLRYLANMLGDTNDVRTVAVAAHDIGEFIRFHPHGKAAVSQLNLKPRLMILLTHQDSRVKKEALLAVQKLMVQDWQMLQSEK